MISANLYTLLFNLLALCLILGALLILWRLGERRHHLLALGLGIVIFTLILF